MENHWTCSNVWGNQVYPALRTGWFDCSLRFSSLAPHDPTLPVHPVPWISNIAFLKLCDHVGSLKPQESEAMLSLLQDVMLAPFSSPTASNGLALTRGPRVVAPATCAKQLPNSLYRYIMWCKGPVGPAPLLNTGLLVDDEFWRVKFQRSDCRGGSCVLSSLYHSLPPPLIAAANKNRLKLDLRLFKAYIYIYIHT